MTGQGARPSQSAPGADVLHPSSTRDDPWRARIVLSAGLGGLILYVLTCAPGVLWQDCGLFQYRVWQWDLEGIIGLPLAHPLYIVLARLFAYLPLGEFAYRVNLFSALCGAVTLAIAADLLLTLTRDRTATVCGVILLGVSHTFWTHSVTTEVYTLYSVGLVAELWLVERFYSRRAFGWLLAAAFVNGLNLSNHLMAILHWPAYLGLMIWGLRARRLNATQIVMLFAAVLVGSMPYLFLILRRLYYGEALVQTLKEALVGPPERAQVVLIHTFPFARQTGRAILYFGLNFPTPLLLLAPLGILAAWQDAARKWFALIGCAILLVGFVFAFRYLVPDQYVFFFPCYVVTALFAALGVARLLHRRGGTLQWACVAAALLPALVYEIAPTVLRARNISFGVSRDLPYRDTHDYFIRPRKNGDDGASRFLRESLAHAAPDGLVIGDSTLISPLAYVRDVDGVHRGVAICIPANVEPLPPVVEARSDEFDSYVRRGRAFALTEAKHLSSWVGEKYDFEPHGDIFRLRPKEEAGSPRP